MEENCVSTSTFTLNESKTCDLVCIWDMDGVMVSENDEGDYRPMARPFLKEALRWTFENCAHVGVWTAASRAWYDDVDKLVLQPILKQLSREHNRKCVKSKESLASPSPAHNSNTNTVINTKRTTYEFSFVWFGDRCTRIHREYADDGFSSSYDPKMKIKCLKKVWRPQMRARFGATRHNVLIIDDTPPNYARNLGNAIPCITFTKDDKNDDNQLLYVINTLQDVKRRYENQNIDISAWIGTSDPTIAAIIHAYSPIRSVRLIRR